MVASPDSPMDIKTSVLAVLENPYFRLQSVLGSLMSSAGSASQTICSNLCFKLIGRSLTLRSATVRATTG